MHQGKFKKMDSFEIYEKYSNYRYKGRLFLFEKSLVYTEQLPKRLIYKGHYQRTKIGIEPERTTSHSSSKPKLILFSEKVGNRCIEVTSDTPVVYEWKNMIDDIIRSFIVEERERVKKGKRPNRAVTLGGKPIEPELRSISRGSVYSMKSLLSDVSSLSSSGSSDRSSKISGEFAAYVCLVDHFYESPFIPFPQWTVAWDPCLPSTERLRIGEQPGMPIFDLCPCPMGMRS